MKILKFEYNKEDEKTDREVILLHNTKTYIDSIDLGHLTEKEREEVKTIYKAYEEKLSPFLEKALRRFSKDKMENLNEEKI